MRYYKPQKTDIITGFKCEIYNDDTYEWEPYVVDDHRKARRIWHNGDLRVAYLSAEDLNSLGYGVRWMYLGPRKVLVDVILNDDGTEEEVYEVEEVYSTEEADLLLNDVVVGKFYPFNFGEDPNFILDGKEYSLKNINELNQILETLKQNGKN